MLGKPSPPQEAFAMPSLEAYSKGPRPSPLPRHDFASGMMLTPATIAFRCHVRRVSFFVSATFEAGLPSRS